MARKDSKHTGNRLLASLSQKDLAPLARHFEVVPLILREGLSKAGRAIPFAYFPERGMISLVQTLEDGATIEVGLVGREGFFGVPLILGSRSSPVEAMVQGEGSAIRIPAEILVAEVSRNERLRGLLLRYTQAHLSQVTQTAACNGRHGVRQRLARWLLEAQDRLGGDTVPISHEFLSFMLGCRRAGVSEGLAALKDSGIAPAGRGAIHVGSRKSLEAASCECYRTTRAEFRRLLP